MCGLSYCFSAVASSYAKNDIMLNTGVSNCRSIREVCCDSIGMIDSACASIVLVTVNTRS
jgi:hypothetical protein